MTSSEHKKLCSLRDRLRRRLNELTYHSREYGQVKAELETVLARLQKAGIRSGEGAGAALVVSEHAIVRYLERVMGYTQEDLALMVLPKAVRNAIAQAGMIKPGFAFEMPVGAETKGGEVTHRVVIKDGVVTTVIAAGHTVMTPWRDKGGKGGGGGLARAANSERGHLDDTGLDGEGVPHG